LYAQIAKGEIMINKQLQTIFLLTDKPIISMNPKNLKEHPLSKELFGDLSVEDFNLLKQDILERGIQDAVHITKDNVVVSGHQRRKIAIELGINVPCIIRNDLKEAWQIEEQLIKDNLLRRQLTDYQKFETGKHLEPIERLKAKQRQKESGEKYGKGVENLPQPIGDKGKSRDKVAKQLGISGRTYDKIKYVGEKAPKEIKEQWRQGELSTQSAYNKITTKNKGMSEHSRNTLFSSEHDNWATPPEIYKKLDAEFHFDFDPCPLNATFNGLEIPWKKYNFINPPYSDIESFLEKSQNELKNGRAEINVFLIPVRTDTKWFHKYIYSYILEKKHNPFDNEIRFKKGRIKFINGNNKSNSAPFPSMIIVFRRKK